MFILEIKYKKISNEERHILDNIEESCYKTMESAIKHIGESCTPLTKTLSPNVANIQMHLNVFEDRSKNDIELANSGIVNYNLCLNAETEHAHTECDSSYTIICVPNQEANRQAKKIKNSGSFEFVVSHEETIVIPMEIGTIITYSGYLLTHRQQIRKKDSEVPLFVNLVSYNSKRLFENMLESFRRYLHTD